MRNLQLRTVLGSLAATCALAMGAGAQQNDLPPGASPILSGATRTVVWRVLGPAPITELPAAENRLLIPIPENARVLGTRYDTDDSEILLGLRYPANVVGLFAYYNTFLCQQGYERQWRTLQSNFASAKYRRGEHDVYLNISLVELDPRAYRVEFDFKFGNLVTENLGVPTGCE